MPKCVILFLDSVLAMFAWFWASFDFGFFSAAAVVVVVVAAVVCRFLAREDV